MGNYGVLMPEIIIYRSLSQFIKILQDDYQANIADVSKSLLHVLFDTDENDDDIKLETFDYLVQAKATLIDKTPQVNIGYNLEVANMGSIHILLPNESGSPLGIGGDENYQPQINTGVDPDEMMQGIFTAKFDSTYQCIITSENLFEVLVIYHFLRVSMVSLHYHLELLGLRNLKIAGQDINIQSDSIPTHIFHRTLTMNFFHETNVPDYLKSKLIKNFKVTGITI